jgi:hypothetical protein
MSFFGLFGGSKKDKSSDKGSREEERHHREKEDQFVRDAFDSEKRKSDERAKRGG